MATSSSRSLICESGVLPSSILYLSRRPAVDYFVKRPRANKVASENILRLGALILRTIIRKARVLKLLEMHQRVANSCRL